MTRPIFLQGIIAFSTQLILDTYKILLVTNHNTSLLPSNSTSLKLFCNTHSKCKLPILYVYGIEDILSRLRKAQWSLLDLSWAMPCLSLLSVRAIWFSLHIVTSDCQFELFLLPSLQTKKESAKITPVTW